MLPLPPTDSVRRFVGFGSIILAVAAVVWFVHHSRENRQQIFLLSAELIDVEHEKEVLLASLTPDSTDAKTELELKRLTRRIELWRSRIGEKTAKISDFLFSVCIVGIYTLSVALLRRDERRKSEQQAKDRAPEASPPSTATTPPLLTSSETA